MAKQKRSKKPQLQRHDRQLPESQPNRLPYVVSFLGDFKGTLQSVGVVFDIRPPFEQEAWSHQPPDHIYYAFLKALPTIEARKRSQKVSLWFSTSDLSDSNSPNLAERIASVINSTGIEALHASPVLLSPDSHQVHPLIQGRVPTNLARTDFNPQTISRLTSLLETQEPHTMREKGKSGKPLIPNTQIPAIPDDPLADLRELAIPKWKTAEIEKLLRILKDAQANGVSDTRRWVDSVQAALEANAVAIRIDQTGEICRRFFIDKNGVIELQNTDGDKRGFKENPITLVPYVRPYKRKQTAKKPSNRG